MAAKGAEARGAAQVPERPEHIPEKFWDAEKGEVRVDDLAKSYAELEKGKSKPKTEMGEKPTEPPKAPDAAPSDMEAHRAKMSEKMARGEAFDDADYAPFEKAGLTREAIDEIAGILAQAAQAQATVDAQAIFAIAGGEDKYAAMIEWGRSNFSAEEIAAFDAALGSTPANRDAAVKGLQARYQLALGAEGTRDVTEKGGKGGSGARFESKAEMVAAMQDPRYAKDSAYRAEVAAKVENSRKAGVNLQF